ncbi:uncharacterized protein LOC111028618 [Myzus persicae]|uniref:uncharacterized protein LOC111028618 n=1 Tax=Myzus persicae TaxID=13164 RepID=UPI000B9350FF|nr:uncharacterized protein LOC111028618 [Myzus persicae]
MVTKVVVTQPKVPEKSPSKPKKEIVTKGKKRVETPVEYPASLKVAFEATEAELVKALWDELVKKKCSPKFKWIKKEPHVTKSGTFASLGKPPLSLITGNLPGEKPAAALLVVNPLLGATLITQFSGTHTVIVEIRSGNRSLHVGSTYFQFSERTELHVERLEKVIRELGGADWIIGGDFNARSTLWNDTHMDVKGETVGDMIMAGDMICYNVGSTPTFYTSMVSAILDLTLASVRAAVKVSGWRVVEDAISSDHRLILFDYDWDEVETTTSTSKRFNVWKADWDIFRQKLAEKLFDGQSSWLEGDIDSRADYLTSAISGACKKSMPYVRERAFGANSWFTESH